jgi:hypothetical protein
MVITIRSILLSFITCHWVCEKGNTAGVNSKAGTAYLFRTPEITPVYSGLVELIRYARASSNYSDFLKRHLHLRNRDKKIFLTFLFLTTYLYTFSLFENPSFIIFSAETEHMSTNKNVKNIFLSMCGVKMFLTFTSLSLVLL